MINFKIISIFVIFSALVFSGCVKPEPGPMETPAPVATPTASMTASTPSVTVAETTPKPTPSSVKTERLYIFDVDEYGFNKLTAINGSAVYSNHTIIIEKGDTVKWVSVTDAGYYLTIISREGLWDNSTSMLRYRFRAFNYTFNQTGEYEVYLKEFPREDHQKIIVNP